MRGDGLEHVVVGNIEITHHKKVGVLAILAFLFELNPFRQGAEFLEPRFVAVSPSDVSGEDNQVEKAGPESSHARGSPPSIIRDILGALS